MTFANDYIKTIGQAFEKFETTLNGSRESFFHAKRKKALATLAEKGLPGPKNEEYKFTNFSKALEKNIAFDVAMSSAEGSFISPFDEFDGYKLFFSNGKFLAEKSDLKKLEGKIQVAALDEAIKNEKELDKFLGKLVDERADAFADLNTVFAKEGVFIRVPKNTRLDKPVYFIHQNDSADEEVLAHYRNLLIVEKGANVQVVEAHFSTGNHSAYTNCVFEVFCEANSLTEWTKLQLENETALRVDNTLVHQQRDSRCTVNTITLSGQMVRNNLYMALDDENTEAHMYGLYLIDGKTHVDNHTVADHKKPHSFSNELYKGIMMGNSHGVFNGKIYVRQDAQKTNAFQQNNNILLSPNATINTKPQLEIWADDVKCSHGCTTGQLDEEQLFYLRARGISKEKAKAMLLHAFASDVLSKIAIEPVREYLEQLISKKIED